MESHRCSNLWLFLETGRLPKDLGTGERLLETGGSPKTPGTRERLGAVGSRT